MMKAALLLVMVTVIGFSRCKPGVPKIGASGAAGVVSGASGKVSGAAGAASGASGKTSGAAGAASGASGKVSGASGAAGGGDGAIGTMIKVMCDTKAEKAVVDQIMAFSNAMDKGMGCLQGKMAKLESCWKRCWIDTFGSSGESGPPGTYVDKQKFFCGGNLDPTNAAKQLIHAMTCCANNTIQTFSEMERQAAKNACGLPVAYFDMTNGMPAFPPMPSLL